MTRQEDYIRILKGEINKEGDEQLIFELTEQGFMTAVFTHDGHGQVNHVIMPKNTMKGYLYLHEVENSNKWICKYKDFALVLFGAFVPLLIVGASKFAAFCFRALNEYFNS
jgi:hypothetical protein